MTRVILEFTLNGHKHTFFKRVSLFGECVVTHNRDSARPIKEKEVPGIIKKLIKEHGKNNITDINISPI